MVPYARGTPGGYQVRYRKVQGKVAQCYVFICTFTCYLDLPLLSFTDYIRLPCSSLLSLFTLISNCPLYYLVSSCLSSYQAEGFYLVQYINPQSSGIQSIELSPLSYILYLLRVDWQYKTCTSILLELEV